MKVEIREEIEDIAPMLLSIGNDLPYLVPEGYFQKVDGSVLDQTVGRDDHTVPDEYFDQLEDRVMAQISQRPAEPSPTVRSLYRIVSAVAAVAVLALGCWWIMRPFDDQVDAMAHISDTDYETQVEILQYTDMTLDEVLAVAAMDEEVLADFMMDNVEDDTYDYLLLSLDEAELEAFLQ